MNLEQLADPRGLNLAWQRVWRNGGGAGADGTGCEEYLVHASARIDALHRRLRAGAHSVAPYRRVDLARPGRSPRVLRIPCVEDRIVQTAFCQGIAAVADDSMHDASHAYRRGRSVDTACRAIHGWHAAGLAEWVVEADIVACFDNIAHTEALARLESLGAIGDPGVEHLVRAWLRAGASRDGIGTAQGSPLSPLVCNLVLTRLDEQLAAAGLLCARYADDLVIATGDAATAGRALAVLNHALADLGLQAHPDKTRVLRYADGFDFLGRRFGQIEPAPAWPAQAPGDSLSEAPLVSAKDQAETPSGVPAEVWPQPATAGMVGHLTQQRTLYVVEPGSAVRCDGERITVVKEGKTLVSTPVRRIAQVAILTNAALTTPAIRLCARFHVPIYLADPYGGGDAVFQHAGDTRIDVLRAQFAAQADAGARLTIAKGFVAGKLHNQLVMLRRYARHRAGQDAARHGNAIRQIAAQAALANSLDVLRGCEGFAAKSYFAGLRALLGADWGFDARIARGSADPFNSALSFTYSLLCRAVLAELRATGFDARIGLFHEARPGHPALASDLMEEFRPLLADSVVLNAFLNGDLAPGDFHQTQAGLRLLPASVKKVVHAFETKLAARVTVAGADGETCYRDAIHTQSTLLAEALAGRAVYRPFKAR